MRRRPSVRGSVFASLVLTSVAALWWGCAAGNDPSTTGVGGGQTTSTTGGGGTGGTGGIDGDFDGGNGLDDAGACTSISAEAERVRLDIIFLIDRSQSMSGSKWLGTTSALTKFFNDPASAKTGAGLSYFPNDNKDAPCIAADYQTLDVPIDVLPGNIFALTNSMPADAKGGSSPTYGALKGVLKAATAHQDAHPKRKVIVVLATDGGPNSCGTTTIDDIAALAKSARNYNGVSTYVIGVQGADIPTINKIAAAGGTTATYDITNDISQFSAKMEEIRGKALGCEFEIPAPPNGKDLDPDKVNFSYTPQGMGAPKVLLRADDLSECAADPGWYYDSNALPTKIVLCPASCATVQADASAKVSVLFGCQSQLK